MAERERQGVKMAEPSIMTAFPTSEFPTFIVRDFSGEIVHPVDLIVEKVATAYFAFDDCGGLWVMYIDMWHDMASVSIPKQGRYRVEFSDGRSLIW